MLLELSWLKEQQRNDRDLGIIITENLKPASQCVKAAAKARSVLGVVRRHFKRLDPQDFLIIYKSYIRPHLEYCIQAWSPYLQKYIYCLDSVQRAATRLVRGFRKVPYEDRLPILGLTTLAVRRKRGDLFECYKILSGKENLDPYQFFQRSDTTHLRGHSCKLSVSRCHLQLRQNFFSQRVIKDWNKLPLESLMHLLLTRSRIVWTRIGRTLDMDIKGSACWSPSPYK